MKSQRHSHPHVDPRQPRNGARPGTNPPVFAWKPPEGTHEFSLVVACDPGLRETILVETALTEPVFLPSTALAPGRYWWQWSASGTYGEVFEFEVMPDAAVLEVPPISEWLERFPKTHPRIWIRPEEVPALRTSRAGPRADLWKQLEPVADELLAQPHALVEPPFLPPWEENYDKAFAMWRSIAFETRSFMQGAETLALAHLAGGRQEYARAACRRLVSVSRWDPEGSSHIEHNDEAHMPVIWWGPVACDWVWEQFTADERALILDQFRRRGRITFEHMHSRGSYGVTRFDSHAGREIVFLAQVALVFHEHIPEARQWLQWLRPVLCGIWPVWAGDDGGWSEGPAYSLAYVQIMTRFAVALKHGAGVDLFRRPFWAGHARWRQWCLPPYAEWMGFGDHTERWSGTWLENADLVDLIGRQTGVDHFGGYVAAFRAEADRYPTPAERRTKAVSPLCYLTANSAGGEAVTPKEPARILQVFSGAGWAAVRTSLTDPAHDVAFILRSSPYGAISHSHANNNDFIIHIAGKVLAQPSGYYDGYGSEHHTHWNWHTKSHNCVTLSDAAQLMRSPDSRGSIENPFEDERLVYFAGNADASYALQADRCRRHVIFLKAHNCFVLIDEFVARAGVNSALQWNIHSWARFAVDEDGRSFLLEREGRRLAGHFLYHHNAFFSLSEGWDPPPRPAEPADQQRFRERLRLTTSSPVTVSAVTSDQWLMQYHLRFTTAGLDLRRNLGVVLVASSTEIRSPQVVTERAGNVELARIGDDTVLVNQGGGIQYGGRRTDALALLQVRGSLYEASDGGVRSV
ncbi:MAG: DUF4962 domain-containing protein [Planctomycetota bacterium]